MLINGVDIRQLRAFAMVGEELSFVKAAARLHVSQPALSQTIRQFEGQLDVPLFERNTRKVALTEAGEALLPQALEILEKLARMAQTASDHAVGLRGSLKVGFLIGAGVDLMPRILSSFARRFPQVKVLVKEFDFSEPHAGIAEGMDVSILRPPLELPEVELITLVEEDCVACLPSTHRLAAQASVSIFDILDDPIVAAPGSNVWRSYWTADQYRQGRSAPVIHEASTVESELQAVASERGISITAASTARFYSRPGLSFPVIRDMPPCTVCVALPAQASVAARNFAELALEVAGRQE
ncbi:LysR family transcriptional regulator [Pseudomonas gingeri NCPPB 3146 = LMG 5327]|uniref:LysR family transcriptional regulator n=2 Tax=Pseudomonas gingeri TaxID=117681 RepID=A0A7Y7XVK3_9PSED|nr:LysR family transcriptional regulator [Pseudomonas gingeri]NWC12889.1 LysR family transcriptional regulator [Pseudomonas gingeri]NWE67713.1 LysR family transcriptional regulator [Pseudomonas gingeri]PNQ94143.1 LysR family transcriptional regulator [Pseudomonas gingeri NCPPB 3146 = LMG 5327]